MVRYRTFQLRRELGAPRPAAMPAAELTAGPAAALAQGGALPPNACVKFITKYAQNASKRNVSTVHGHAFPKDLRASTVKVYDIKLISYLKILS